MSNRKKIAALRAKHNAALKALTPDQARAVERLMVASMAALEMSADGSKPEPHFALSMIIEKEANGNVLRPTMWDKPAGFDA